jgi:hypothetical protein
MPSLQQIFHKKVQFASSFKKRSSKASKLNLIGQYPRRRKSKLRLNCFENSAA